MQTSFRDIWTNYRSEALFFFCLLAFTVLSHWLSRFIPVDIFENDILLIEHGANTAICIGGAWLMFRHADGMRMRRAFAYALAAWGISEVFFLMQTCFLHQPVLSAGSDALSAYMLFAGNLLGWLLLLYPTEALRPGWMSWKKAMMQLLPLMALCGLNYLIPLDLRWLISLYPVALFVLVMTHIRAYRIWCENNYSTMEHIDAQWIVRYLIMLLVVGTSYGYMVVSDHPCRAFTQNLLIQFMFVYSIGEILFRKDPWDNLTEDRSCSDDGLTDTESDSQAENVRLLEQWMKQEKPYLRSDFQLKDIREVLPMNRTYLSEFINATYGCTFYQFVNRYRVEEAKRLMRECPDMKMVDVATCCGFSSQAVFSQTFSKETGMSPREWCKKVCNT